MLATLNPARLCGPGAPPSLDRPRRPTVEERRAGHHPPSQAGLALAGTPNQKVQDENSGGMGGGGATARPLLASGLYAVRSRPSRIEESSARNDEVGTRVGERARPGD
jgi:hypothetical protein